ncbi:protein phosphatase 1 regulatory subunit 3C-B-like [Poeciliopsis prolifica]|uniref:protein phosphatase 1 regulatory subunit 3C-B-like n=1 Tax=Poeciliopsis prolifica TaxID=188132 RepID=UPI0024142C02|nr:protein phosphatase 1 regulatory subunit 3C-B-like [Poeciliopsis prolifica]
MLRGFAVLATFDPFWSRFGTVVFQQLTTSSRIILPSKPRLHGLFSVLLLRRRRPKNREQNRTWTCCGPKLPEFTGNCRKLPNPELLHETQQTPFPIMPEDMAIRICLASSPPLRSFLSNHDCQYAPASAGLSCRPLRPCLSSGCSNAVSLEAPASAPRKSPRKSVAFADSQGLALTTVHIFTEDDPLAELQFHLTELEGALDLEVKESAESGSGLVLDFTPPAADYLDLRNRLKAQHVCLESCSVQEHLLSGTVQVRNICFEKSVSVRITFDSWSSFQDVRCRYLNNVYGCPDIDTFTFSIPLPPDLVPSSQVEFCIWYQTKDQVHWDNNLGNNYRLAMADPAGRPDRASGRSPGRDVPRDCGRQKTDRMDFDPFGSPRTSLGIFPEWQSWGRVETGAPYW